MNEKVIRETQTKINSDSNDENIQTFLNAAESNKKNQINLDHIENEENRHKIRKILNKYANTINDKPGRTKIIEHKIELKENKTFKAKEYIVPQKYKSEVNKELETLLRDGLIEKCDLNEYSSPMVIVRKKNGKLRLCCDYRKLNEITKIDQEGLPNIEDIINTMGNNKIFSTIDLTRGFWQIAMEENSKQYTAFRTSNGLFQWKVMPFGLVNSTATFTKMMRQILKPHPNMIHYVDDICIFSNTWQEHYEALEHLFKTLQENNLTVSPDKIKIGFPEIEFLGHKFTKGGITTTENFQEKILHIKTPKTKKQVRSLLGLFNYYAKFIDHYNTKVKPLIELTKKNQPTNIKWNEECQKSLTELQNEFSKKPILDTLQEHDNVILATDASNQGLGVCLMRETMDETGKIIYKPTHYLSRALTKSEKNYSIIELECLAIVWAVNKLQRFLLGRNFKIFVDHKPLAKFNVSNINNNRINKFAMKLTDYQFTIQTVKGIDNHIPDILSRLSTNIA